MWMEYPWLLGPFLWKYLLPCPQCRFWLLLDQESDVWPRGPAALLNQPDTRTLSGQHAAQMLERGITVHAKLSCSRAGTPAPGPCASP